MEGTSVAGTETITDFLFEDNTLKPFLTKISKKTAQYLILRFCLNPGVSMEALQDRGSLHIMFIPDDRSKTEAKLLAIKPEMTRPHRCRSYSVLAIVA